MTYKYFVFVSIVIVLMGCTARENHDAQDKEFEKHHYFEHTRQDTTKIIDEYLSNTNFDILVQKFEDPARLSWQNPDLVLEKLGDLEGKTIADLGAGSGYFTFRMAQSAQLIIAIDIDPRFLEYIEQRRQEIPSAQAEKIKTRLTVEHDPSLEREEVDIVLVVNTFHFIKNRPEYFGKVKRGLKRDGFLVIVDFKTSDLPIAPPKELIVAPEVAFMELRQAGFSEFTIDEKSLQYQYVIIAR